MLDDSFAALYTGNRMYILLNLEITLEPLALGETLARGSEPGE